MTVTQVECSHPIIGLWVKEMRDKVEPRDLVYYGKC